MATGEHQSRRKFLEEGGKVAAGGLAGAGLTKAVEAFFPHEELVGGNWTEHRILNRMLRLGAIPNANGDGLVHDVTFTIRPDTAPDFVVDLTNPHQYPPEDGGWYVLGIVTPDPNTGECFLEVPGSKLGKPPNGKYIVSFDTWGFDKRVKRQTTDSINLSPNGEKEVPTTDDLNIPPTQ